MSTKIPKQLLWILDYEDYLDHRIAMTDEGRKWVELHKRQLDTAEKREQLLHWYAPSDLDEDKRKYNGWKKGVKRLKRGKSVRSVRKPAKKRRRKRKDKELALYMRLELSWETTKRMGFTEKDEIQILKNYRDKGLSLGAIETITKIKRDELIAKGVPT